MGKGGLIAENRVEMLASAAFALLYAGGASREAHTDVVPRHVAGPSFRCDRCAEAMTSRRRAARKQPKKLSTAAGFGLSQNAWMKRRQLVEATFSGRAVLLHPARFPREVLRARIA